MRVQVPLGGAGVIVIQRIVHHSAEFLAGWRAFYAGAPVPSSDDDYAAGFEAAEDAMLGPGCGGVESSDYQND